MGIKLSDFAITGTDVSDNNGVIDWNKMLCNISVIRLGYGKTTDSRALRNWKNAKGKVDRAPYWYLDYYSNTFNKKSPVYGMSDVEWGYTQAEYCWSLIKDDPSAIVFLDIEDGGASYSKPLSDPETQEHAETIARAFLERMDQLNGKFNGIYCSVGRLNWFYKWFRNRPLWVAWYNEAQTISSVLAAVKEKGWTGEVLMWQYASDGDIDDNGSADGQRMGCDSKFLDLNAWTSTLKRYQELFGKEVTGEDPVIEDPIIIPETVSSYRITCGSLFIRELSNANDSTRKLGLYFKGTKVFISDVQNGFGKIYNQNGWISLSTKYTEKVI